MPHIAVLGLGRMGSAIAARLLETGHEVTVWNRTAAKAEALAALGAKSADTPARAVSEAAYVVSMLSGPAALEAVMDEAVPALPDGCVLVEMSTVGPDSVRALAARLPAGVSMVDAPVMGSVDKAREGSLRILTGGGEAAVEAARSVLADLGTVDACGPLGSGAAMKLVVNHGMIASLAVLGETRALADALGLPGDVVRDVLSAGPLAGLQARADATTADFPIAHAVKDLALAATAADRALPVTEAARAAFVRTTDAGLGQRDLAEAVQHIRTAEQENAMRVTYLNPDTVPAPGGPYTHTARVDLGTGSLLYLSGQVALDDNGDVIAPGDMTAQSEHVFRAIKANLEAHGGTLGDIVNIRTFITDMDQRAEHGRVRVAYLTGTPPTSTLVEVSRLFKPGLVVEVEVVAVLGKA